MSNKTVLVINPNSNTTVTAGLADALGGWDGVPGITIECVTLEQGPFGIESEADILAVEPLLLQEIAKRDDCAAYVVACYSDPGLASCRAATSRPVFGMQQSAVLSALAMGGRFGVLALSDASIERHLRYLKALGFIDHLVGERPLDLTVDEAAHHPEALQRIIEQGQRLRDKDGASSIILGCAGMAGHRAAAEAALRIPVIEPTQAAVMQAVGRLL